MDRQFMAGLKKGGQKKNPVSTAGLTLGGAGGRRFVEGKERGRGGEAYLVGAFQTPRKCKGWRKRLTGGKRTIVCSSKVEGGGTLEG